MKKRWFTLTVLFIISATLSAQNDLISYTIVNTTNSPRIAFLEFQAYAHPRYNPNRRFPMRLWQKQIPPHSSLVKEHQILNGMKISITDTEGNILEEGITPAEGSTITISK